MFKLNEIWGIDIGSYALKAVKLVKIKGQIVISDFDIIDVEEIEGYEGSDEDYYYEKIKKAIFSLVNRKRLRNQKVVVVLPGRSAMVKKIQFPTTDVKRVEKMIKYEAAQQIPFPLTEVVWDYQLLGLAESGVEYEVSLFAIKKVLEKKYLDILQEAQLDVELLQVSPMALYNFIHFDMPPEENENIILLDVGARNSDLVICAGQNFLIRNIPTAGEDITKAFQRKFSVSFEEAEKIKHELTDSKQSQKLFSKVVEPILSELSGDMQRTMNFFSSQHAGVKFSGIVTSGATFQMPGVLQFLADRLQIGVINIDELEKLSVALRNVDEFYNNLPRMGLAIGGALQAIDEGPVKTNLLPAEMRAEKAVERKKPYAFLAIAVVIIAVIISYLVAANARDYLTNEINNSDELITESKKYEKGYKALVSQVVPIQKRCNEIVRLSGILEDVSKGKGIVSRYVIVETMNSIITSVDKFNDPQVEQESLWIDDINLEIIPDTWDSIVKKIESYIVTRGSLNLGGIEELKKPVETSERKGATRRRPGARGAGKAKDKGSEKKLLLCFIKGRTRKKLENVKAFQREVDRKLESVLFTAKDGKEKVGGALLYTDTYKDTRKDIPTVSDIRAGGRQSINVFKGEEKEYVIFKIVWIIKTEKELQKKKKKESKKKGKSTAKKENN